MFEKVILIPLLEQNEKNFLRNIIIDLPDGPYHLTLLKEDLTKIYPGMYRYTLNVTYREQPCAIFRTNSYEYPPTSPIEVEKVALGLADEWEHELKTNPKEFFITHRLFPQKSPEINTTDVVIIQGSPRPDGNCGILAGWSLEAAHQFKKTAQIIFPHDMDIRPCIGCYQCYNTGICTFNDDMHGIIKTIRQSSLLVICTPVYTNTVPGGLKILIDRCQAYHAGRLLGESQISPKGLLFSVAGRKGAANFTCVKRVVKAFMRNLSIEPVGEILIDGMDEQRDIRKIAQLEKRIQKTIQDTLSSR